MWFIKIPLNIYTMLSQKKDLIKTIKKVPTLNRHSFIEILINYAFAVFGAAAFLALCSFQITYNGLAMNIDE